jgi:hypothetical protein
MGTIFILLIAAIMMGIGAMMIAAWVVLSIIRGLLWVFIKILEGLVKRTEPVPEVVEKPEKSGVVINLHRKEWRVIK